MRTDWGAVLKNERLRVGMKQREVCARSGYSPATVSNIESGKRSPSIRALEDLLQAVGCRLTVKR